MHQISLLSMIRKICHLTTSILFTAFRVHYNNTRLADMLCATVHMVQIRMLLNNSINLLCTQPAVWVIPASCVSVYKRIRTVGMIVYENKGV